MLADDLFPGFESHWYDTAGGRLHAKVGGASGGEAVLLLHGFPQSSVGWHSVAPELARDRRVICLDLKGYGRSEAPQGDRMHVAYSKRTMAREALEVMTAEGCDVFSVLGHDRGAQVAYRLALDHPDHVRRLGILDNLPICSVWDLIEADPTGLPHWRSLAREGDQAELEIDEAFLLDILRSHTADGTLDAFGPEALASYRQDWTNRARKHAYAEDYRAGATVDREDDLADLREGKVVMCPTLVMWGEAFLGRLAESPLDTWRRTFTPDAVGIELACGHFLIEEKTAEALEGMRHLLEM